MLAPNSKVSWSAILPKYDDSYNRGINFINQYIFNRYRMIKKMGKPVNHGDFFKKNRSVDPTLFCQDGVHLSYKGVTALERSLKYHVTNF
jgi:hypothetical protein